MCVRTYRGDIAAMKYFACAVCGDNLETPSVEFVQGNASLQHLCIVSGWQLADFDYILPTYLLIQWRRLHCLSWQSPVSVGS